jgi:hypothetical protein
VIRRKFYEVRDWAAYQYADRRKVPNPPWKWFRVQVALLRSPEWLGLSAAQRADFIAALGAASETGNLIPDDPRWLHFRGLSRRSLASLVRESLVGCISLPNEHPRIRQLRRVLSGAAPDPEDRGQRTEDRYQKGKEYSESVNSRPLPRHDPRTFDQIKTIVRELWRAFPGHTPQELHKLGGRGKRLTLNQVREAYRQLRDDGELSADPATPRSTSSDGRDCANLSITSTNTTEGGEGP